MILKTEDVAAVAHEANRKLRAILGEVPMESWENAPDHMKLSVINGVTYRLNNPGVSDAENHANWLNFKVAQGWKLGPVEDRAKKIHPNLVPYEQLPPEQKIKDALFGSIVKALAPMTRAGEGGSKQKAVT